jgi:hypothetical protein
MSDERRVQRLVTEILDSKRTPEEVCADCPELLGEVRRLLQDRLRVEAELEALFPKHSDVAIPRISPSADRMPIPNYTTEANDQPARRREQSWWRRNPVAVALTILVLIAVAVALLSAFGAAGK